MRHDFSTKFSPIWSPFCLFTCWKKGSFYPQYTSSHMISKYGRHVINRRPLHIVKKKKKKKKKSNGAQFTLCGFLGKSAYITEFSCQFCILNTSNFSGFVFEVSLKCGQSCGETVLKMKQWNPGHFGSDFRDGAPCMNKYQKSGIFVMKVESFLDILSLLCVVKIDF